MKKILIVEDDTGIREELIKLLENNGYQVQAISDFRELKEQILLSGADLVLLDILIPGISGEFLLKELRRASQIPVIMVTSKNTEMDEMLCMTYGADDYITKPYHPAILLLHIEAVLKRAGHAEAEKVYRGWVLNTARSTLEKEKEEILLSKNELGIFCFLLQNQGKIVSREDMMNYLWDTEKFIDDNTLTVNVTRLRKKLEEAGLRDVIETRRGQGYLLV